MPPIFSALPPGADVISEDAYGRLLTRMYGPTVRCKGEFGDGQVVLRQCIRARRGASCCSGP